MTDYKIVLGISSCLLGNNVRYDGGHKYDAWLVETLGPWVQWVPVCPEVECGLPVPREALRLVGDPEKPQLVHVKSGVDQTQRMLDWSTPRIEALRGKRLCGYVFKSKSPSSGMERVKVYPPQGGPARKIGVGIFAREFMKAFPLLPVEEEGRLHDPVLRENFIERIFIMKRWNDLLSGGSVSEPTNHSATAKDAPSDSQLARLSYPKPGELVDFHTRHKLLIMAHSVSHYRSMGKLVADIKSYQADEFARLYLEQLSEAVRKPATLARHLNVLQHIMGYFKTDLSATEKAELLDIFAKYRARHYPLIVPVTLLNHYVNKYDKAYLKSQYYLNPHPVELNLRNHS